MSTVTEKNENEEFHAITDLTEDSETDSHPNATMTIVDHLDEQIGRAHV